MLGYNLTWDNFPKHMKQVFSDLRSTEYYSDVTIVCDDQKILKAHRFILSSCSEVFKTMLDGFQMHNLQPCIYLRGIKYKEMELVLKYIYNGEATFEHELLDTFLRVARDLKVKDIEQDDNESDKNAITKFLETPKEQSDTEVKFSGTPKVQSDIKKVNTSDDAENIDSLQQDFDQEDHDLFKTYIYSNLKICKNSDGQYQCPVCKKCFNQGYKMKCHYQTIHEGIRWPCSKCDYQSRFRDTLNKHMKHVHGNQIPFKCNKCNFESKLKSSMINHFKHNHSHAEYIEWMEAGSKQENNFIL